MNCYESSRQIKPFDLLVAEGSEFDLTRNKVYVARNLGYGNLVEIENDLGIVDQYSTEYFRFYTGERV